MTTQAATQSRRVFLSASIPPADLLQLRQREDAWEDYYLGFLTDPEEVETAIRGLVTQLLGAGVTLVFGGHPTITPIITDIGRRVQRTEDVSIEIYQSAFFAGREAFDRRHDGLIFRRILWTPLCRPSISGPEPCTSPFALGEYPLDRADHLVCAEELAHLSEEDRLAWRDASLAFLRREMISGCDAALFLGGMGRLEEELELFRELNPGRPAWLVSRPGGRTARLVQRFQTGDPPGLPWHPEMGRDYDAMALGVLRELGGSPGGRSS